MRARWGLRAGRVFQCGDPNIASVMPGLDPGIHAFRAAGKMMAVMPTVGCGPFPQTLGRLPKESPADTRGARSQGDRRRIKAGERWFCRSQESLSSLVMRCSARSAARGQRSGPAPWKLCADALCLAPAAGACAPGCAGDRGARSWPRHNPWNCLTCRRLGRIAQLVEQLTLNQRVPGSSPGAPTNKISDLSWKSEPLCSSG
jgi:hypothetical protein